MPDALCLGNSAPMGEPTEARFGLRSLLGAMTLVSLLAAISGAILQYTPPAARERLLVCWTIWLATSVLYVAVSLFRQKRAEELAGPTVCRVPKNSGSSAAERRFSHFVAVALFFMCYVLATYLVIESATAAGRNDWYYQLLFPAMFGAFATRTVLTHTLLHNSLRFCENGILWERKVLPWADLLEHKWIGHYQVKLELHSVDGVNKHPWLLLAIDSGIRDQVEKVIQSKIATVPTLPLSARQVGINQLPLHVALSKQHVRRHLWFVALSIIAGGWFAYLAIIQRTGIREFDDMLVMSFYFYIFAGSLRYRWISTSAGPVRARVFARRDAVGFVLTIAGAICVFYATVAHIWPWEWVYYVAGSLFVYLSLAAASYYFLTLLDLREERVIMPGAFQWPWRRVQIIAWEQASGRLILSCGWRRVIATVPEEQWAAVDQILKEKTGYSG